jgi:hypothetical protein
VPTPLCHPWFVELLVADGGLFIGTDGVPVVVLDGHRDPRSAATAAWEVLRANLDDGTLVRRTELPAAEGWLALVEQVSLSRLVEDRPGELLLDPERKDHGAAATVVGLRGVVLAADFDVVP